MTPLIPIGELSWVDPLLVNGVRVLGPEISIVHGLPELRARVSVFWGKDDCFSIPAKSLLEAHTLAGEIVTQVNNAKRLQERFKWELLKAKEQELRNENRRQEQEMDALLDVDIRPGG